MTERDLPLADGAAACPFVAFEDDRDERASVPDHRHRCYADARPAPRALAHQQAYCLSSAFPVCPTFQDWARREAARARDVAAGVAATAAAASAAAASADAAVPPADSPDAAAPSVPAAAAPGEARSAAAEADDDADADDADGLAERDPDVDDFGVRRNPPRDWAAPPPWLASAEGRGPAHREGDPPPFLERRADPGAGLAGSAADLLAGGPPPERRPDERPVAGGGSPGHGASDPFERAAAASDEFDDRDEAPPSPRPRRPRAYAQHLGGTDGPDWERPRRYEAYPTIKTRMALPSLPRIAVMGGAIAIAAVALFFLPALLGLGGGSGSPAASGVQGSPRPSVSIAPTQAAAPTPILYTIKKGETLLKIANAHGVTLEALMAANPDIKNPNKISEGQQITIPTASDAPPSVGGSAGSSASP